MRIATEQLADIRGGQMVEELTEALAEVVNAVVTVTDEIKKTVQQEKRTEGAEDEPDNRRLVASNGHQHGCRSAGDSSPEGAGPVQRDGNQPGRQPCW